MAHQELEAESSPSGAETPPKLLVIDDDLSICTVIEKLGVKAGFVASHAGSLEDAIRLVRTHQFDCITLDLNLRGNNGISLLRILADMVCTTPIIVISGSMPKLRDLAAKVGNMMHLKFLEPIPKPIDFGKLRVTLAGVKRDLDLQKNA